MAGPSTDWADDAALADAPAAGQVKEERTETTDEKTGITTVVEWRVNDEGKKVKVTRRLRRALQTTRVNHVVAERMGWTKFGLEKGNKPGPDTGTTVVGEGIRIKITPGGIKRDEPVPDEGDKLRQTLAGKKITCRICQGDHYTTRCPYKDTLGGALGEEGGDTGEGPTPGEAAAGGLGAGGRYVPPSMRPENQGKRGEAMGFRGGNRDDLPTLRVTNLSEDATEDDLWALFARFNRISRIFVGKDQATGLCKGFAFVSFEDKKEAEKAMAKINGLPYDHLILACAWSLPRTQEGETPRPGPGR